MLNPSILRNDDGQDRCGRRRFGGHHVLETGDVEIFNLSHLKILAQSDAEINKGQQIIRE